MRWMAGIALVLGLLIGPAWGLGVQFAWDYTYNSLVPATSFVMYRDTDCLGIFTVLAEIATGDLTSSAP